MKIEKIKKVGSKYKIYLENDEIITTYEDVIIKYGILYKKNINIKLLNEINDDTEYFKYYNKAIDLINRRLRSEYEIIEFLKKNKVKDKYQIKIIEALKRNNLLNDKLYAKAYTNDKINLSLDGPYKIKKYLENNKIDEEYIEEAILNINQDIIDNHIDKIISKKIKNNTKYTPYILKQKIQIYLINLGYSKKDISNRLDNFEIKKINSEKEMNKIFNKLKTKFEGEILIFKLKNKLYSRGYTKEEIEDYINKNSSLI